MVCCSLEDRYGSRRASSRFRWDLSYEPLDGLEQSVLSAYAIEHDVSQRALIIPKRLVTLDERESRLQQDGADVLVLSFDRAR
jgi:hypothetical protein